MQFTSRTIAHEIEENHNIKENEASFPKTCQSKLISQNCKKGVL